jgi:hypothetical protein
MSETPNEPNVETNVETYVDNGPDPKHAAEPDESPDVETPGHDGDGTDDESEDDDDDETTSS